MVKVLAIDPGPHVGLALWDEQQSPNQNIWEWTPDTFWEFIEGWVFAVDVIVCENFIIGGARAREANETIEMIGVLRYLCLKHDTPFVLQPPADALAFSTREKLQRVGWWIRGGSDHARAASKHLLLYCVREKLLDASLVLE